MRAGTRSILKPVIQTVAAITLIICTCLTAAAQQSRIQYYQLVKGFVAESKNAYGRAIGNGFVSDNPWGQYTAFLMATNDKGQRTFRIEHYLPNPATGTAQASTLYLLEGSN